MKLVSKTQKAIGLLIGFCITLVFIRIQYTKSLFFGFLLWNIFLAFIPYLISEALKMKQFSKTKIILILAVWLLFLPNAPYMITDIVHLKNSRSTLVWYDIFMLFSFANCGLLLTIISMNDVYKILEYKFSKIIAHTTMVSTAILCGFGVYLGRFIRLNSWDLFTKPLSVFQKCFNVLKISESWISAIGFASLILILLFLWQSFSITKKN